MAIAFSESVSETEYSTSSTIDATAVSVSVGDLLVTAGFDRDSKGTQTVSDSAGNSFTERSVLTYSAANLRVGYSIVTTADASDVVTYTWDSSWLGRRGIMVAVFTGDTIAYDTGAIGTGGGTAFATSNFSTSGTDEVAVAFAGTNSVNSYSSHEIDGAADGTDDADYLVTLFYQIYTATKSNINANVTYGAAGVWVIDCVAFTNTAAGGGVVPLVSYYQRRRGYMFDRSTGLWLRGM